MYYLCKLLTENLEEQKDEDKELLLFRSMKFLKPIQPATRVPQQQPF